MLGFSLTVVTGVVFYKCKTFLTASVGAENFYLLLAYSAVIPPFLLNKIYDLIVKKAQNRTQKRLAQDIDENDETMNNESNDIKDLIKNKKNDTRDKIERFKEIELSKRTL